ncbi:MAG: DegT/DnrJ/EryC1/StrS family aminotransferase [bacterium]
MSGPTPGAGPGAGRSAAAAPAVAPHATPAPERIGLGLALRRQHAALLPAFHAALDEIVSSSAFVMGPAVAQLERALADRVGGGREAIAVHSGTDALLIALRALEIGPGDEVIIPAFTFFATAEAVVLAGATPVIVDIEDDTMTIDAAQVASRISERTRAIIPVHLYGQCANVEALRAACGGRARPIAIIEDMAQALGATRAGVHAGALGDLAAVSFYVTKNLGALGDGGLIFARDPDVAARTRRLRDHGSSRKYFHEEAGFNSRLDTLQAAFILAKLPLLDSWTARRRAIAADYTRAFRGLSLQLPVEAPSNIHVYHQYSLRTPARDAFRAHLSELGIETGIHYPTGMHEMPALAAFAGGVRCPRTDRAAAEVVCLPIFPEMTDSDVSRVVEAVTSFRG